MYFFFIWQTPRQQAFVDVVVDGYRLVWLVVADAFSR